MKFQISHNSFYYHFTALLNLLRTDDFATGGNGSDFIQLILWSEKKIIRSFALASWPCQHHISELNRGGSIFHGRISAHDYESLHRGRAKSRGLLPVSLRIARSEDAPTQCDCFSFFLSFFLPFSNFWSLTALSRVGFLYIPFFLLLPQLLCKRHQLDMERVFHNVQQSHHVN